MSELLDYYREQNVVLNAQITAACNPIGGLRYLVDTPDAPDREKRLAEVLARLEAALFGRTFEGESR